MAHVGLVTSKLEGKPTNTLPTAQRYSDVFIESHQLGVYRLFIAWARPQPFSVKQPFRDLNQFKTGYLPTIYRLLSDTYRIAPGMSVLFAGTSLYHGFRSVVGMKLSTRLFRLLEAAMIEKTASRREVLVALGLVIAWSGATKLLSDYEWVLQCRLRNRVLDYFDLKIMERDLKQDLSTVNHEEDPDGPQETSSEDAWAVIRNASSLMQRFISAATQIIAIVHFAFQSRSFLLPLAYIARMSYSSLTTTSVWEQSALGYITNEDYTRLVGLNALVKPQFRQELIAGNLVDWVLAEYRKVKENLVDIPIEHPLYQYSQKYSNSGILMTDLLDNLPFILSVGYALTYPESFPLSSVAMASSWKINLLQALSGLTMNDEEVKQEVIRLRELYVSMDEAANHTSDRTMEYPHPESNPAGMAFDLKNIGFSYPGSDEGTPSLTDVNLSIPSGSIVVLVGANGSGKSTLIRLLSRLYEPTSGSIIIDGSPSSSYTASSLRQSSVILAQDHQVFPFTFAENIGLGWPESVGNMDLVRDAAEKGGARGFIEKYEAGFDTSMDPHLCVTTNLLEDPDHPLALAKKNLKKKIDMSGGEKQRPIASRAFMRMNGQHIRFVAVDEPTSALDSEGELHLFTQLLEARQGKTMIFVTHRFGYLTKRADIIVCLKDGRVEEVGTHSQLMEKPDGEYAKLYTIQASAFLDEPR